MKQTARRLIFLVSTLLLAQAGFAATTTVYWSTVTTNSDGSPVTGLAGYRVFQSTTATNLLNDTTMQAVADASIVKTTTTATWLAVSTLLPGTTYNFRVTAYSTSGGNSAFNVSSVTMLGVQITTFTPYNPPLSPVPTAVSSTSLLYNWGANGNPAGIYYTAQLSANNFATILASSQTLNTSVNFTGINPNTTYYFEVQTSSSANAPASAFVVAPATSTYAVAPSSAPLGSVTHNAIVANWGANGNPSWTVYLAQTALDDLFNDIVASSRTYNSYATLSGLLANTTYYSRVAAFSNNGSTTAFAVLPTTTTLIYPPGLAGTTFIGVGLSSIAVAWANGGNPAGTAYNAQISTNNFESVNFTSTTANLSAIFGTGGAGGALLQNASYYFKVQAVSNGQQSVFLNLGTQATLALPPTAAAYSGVSGSGLQANWTANGDSAGTLYYAEISASPSFNPITASTQTANLFAAFSGLQTNTVYYGRVAAYSLEASQWTSFTALGSTLTAVSSLPAPASPAFTAATTSGLTANWLANGNPNGTTYYAQISLSQTMVPVLASVQTLNLAASFTGLSANTTYYGQVAAYNLISSTWTAFVSLGSSSTLADAPTTPVVAVAPTAATLDWSAAGNPAGTQYTAQLSYNNFGTIAASSVTLNPSATFSGLASNTTIYLEVQAKNNDGVATTFIVAPTTSTMVASPLSAQPSGVTSTGLQFNWGADGNSPTTLYRAQISTNNFVTVNASSKTYNTYADATGLIPNTLYYGRVQAFGNDGSLTGYVTLPSTQTLIASPGASGTPFPVIGASSITVQWTSGGNAAGTTYLTQISTNNFATVNFTSSTLNLTAAFGTNGAGSALSPNTSYYFQVQATNGSNFSLVVPLGLTETNALPPIAAAYSGVAGTTLQANWSANGDSAGTVYLVELSASPSFSPVLASAETSSLSNVFTGLSPNTVFYGQVAAYNLNNGTWTSFTSLGSTSTITALPLAASPAFTAVGTNGLTANWLANGNPAGATYYAQISLSPSFTPVLASSQTLNLSAAFSSLNVNTTYYGQVAVYDRNTSTWTAFTSLGGESTLADAPTTPSVAVALTAATLNWSANGNPAGTQYTAQISYNNFGTIAASSVTLNPSATFSGLASNTTVYLQVQADNNNSVPTVFAVAPTTSTMVAAPISAQPSGVTGGAIQFNWGANGNAATTRYLAQISLSPTFSPVLSSSQTTNASATFTGLSPNTLYYGQVAADGNDGSVTAFTVLPSTLTLLASPTPAATPFTSVGTAGIAVQWNSGGNATGTTYLAQISTDGITVNFTSSTLNLSAAFGAGGAGSALSPGTSYYFSVQATNGVDSSALVPIGSTSTLAVPPTAEAYAFVFATNFQANWASNGNGAGTLYNAQISLSPSLSPVLASSQTANLYAAFTGLSPSTTYYGQVEAINSNGIATSFVGLGQVVTGAPPPGQPGTPVGFVLGSSSISWNWSAASGASNYSVYQANGGALLGSTPSTAFIDGSLGGNTPNAIQVQGVNTSGPGPLSAASLTLYTLANQPVQTTVNSVQANSDSFSWSINGNSTATIAVIDRSLDGVTFANISSAAVTSYTDSNLVECTSYYYRVRNNNAIGVPTTYDATVEAMTLSVPPLPANSFQAVPLGGNRIGLSWTPPSSSGITSYAVYYDSGTGTVNYNTALAVLSGATTSYITGVLTSSASYTFGLRVSNHCNLQEENTNVLAHAPSIGGTLSGVRATIQWPQAGYSIEGNLITIIGGLYSGTPYQTKNVLFQFKASSTTVWSAIPTADPNHVNPAVQAPFVLHWDTTLLTPGNYDLQAVATDFSGNVDTTPVSITITILANGSPSANLDETYLGGGAESLTQPVYTEGSNLIMAGAQNANWVATVLLPAQALDVSTAAITVTNNPSGVPGPNIGLIPLGAATQITLSNGQTQLSAGQLATVSISYQDPANSGIVEGTNIQANKLQMYYYNVASAAWEQLPTTLDSVNHVLNAQTPHFTLFAAFATEAVDLSMVRVYPNPFEPNGGNPNQGVNYSPGIPLSGIIFDQLPQSTTIKIYTITGQLVTTLNGSNLIQWSVQNDGGRNVATGGYVAVITAPGQKPLLKKILVVR